MMRSYLGVLTGFFLMSFVSAAEADQAQTIAGLNFTAPAGWESVQPSSSMRAFEFRIPGAGGENAEMSVFYFGPGQGGDAGANIARWKGQFAELQSETTDTKQVNGIPVTVIRLAGTYQPSMGPMMNVQSAPMADYFMQAAIVEGPQGSVFFKMTGPAAAADAAETGFESLVESLTASRP